MVNHIREARVVNGFVLIQTDSTLLKGVEVKQSWWVVSPSRKIEKGFSNHQQYLDSLKILGFKMEPQLHDMDAIASFYEDNDTMDWNEMGTSAIRMKNNLILFSQNGSK